MPSRRAARAAVVNALQGNGSRSTKELLDAAQRMDQRRQDQIRRQSEILSRMTGSAIAYARFREEVHAAVHMSETGHEVKTRCAVALSDLDDALSRPTPQPDGEPDDG